MLLLEDAEHALAGRRRIVVRDDGLTAEFGHRDLRARGQWMLRMHEDDELVGTQPQREQAALGGLECHHAEVESTLKDFDADLTRRHASDVHLNLWMRVAKAIDERQQRVHRAFVCSHEHTPAAQVPQFAHGLLRFVRETHQPLRIIAQHAAGLGQRSLLGRSIEQALAELVLETADGLADSWLGTMQLGRGARKASLGGYGQKDLQFGEIHAAPEKTAP